MKNIMKRISAVFMALCMCFSVFAISSFAFGFNNTNSTDGLDRNVNDIQPMNFDYVRKNINTMVQGMTNKYVLKDSSNVDLSRDVYIVDPRIVNVKVDTSDVDWNTYGVYPIRYTVCFKPSVQDSYKTLSLSPDDSRAYDMDAKVGGLTKKNRHTNRSLCYVYTDCASKLNQNEYVAITFGAKVNIGAPTYLDNIVKQAVPVYQSNTQMYSTSKRPEVPARYYNNLVGNFSYKEYKVVTPFNLIIGEQGYYCSRCGKRFTYVGQHSYVDASYADDAVSAHVCDDGKGYNWITFDGHERDFKVGDTFNVEIFSSNF